MPRHPAATPPSSTSSTGSDILVVLRALSIVLDLANGLREDKSLATALFAHDLAVRCGLDEAARSEVFFAALLRHVGCTSYAHREAILVEDDVLLRRALATADSRRVDDLARALVAANPSGNPAHTLTLLAEGGPEERVAWTSEACGGACALASTMGFGAGVLRALEEVFERYDGRGAPNGLGGEAISMVGRLTTVAHLTLAHYTVFGAAAARHALTSACNTVGTCDPKLAELARDALDERPGALLTGTDERLLALMPSLSAHTPAVDLRQIAEAFGDFADLQSKHTRGHSRGVAGLVTEGSRQLGLSSAEQEAVVLAAYLHDIGAAAVPTRIWETRDTWSEAARERARMHVYYTERALSLATPLSKAAPIAGAHHERLDATGYHRGLASERIGIGARLLAAADVFHALREDRPHRAARTRSAAKEMLHLMATEGALDARSVDAVLAGPNAAPRNVDGLSTLTSRERDVLRQVARGQTNKEIAAVLGISDRTVQTHTLHIYDKLGVDTRAAAAIVASRAGLLECDQV